MGKKTVNEKVIKNIPTRHLIRDQVILLSLIRRLVYIGAIANTLTTVILLIIYLRLYNG